MKELLTPAIVSALLTGILAPLIFHFLKQRDEEKKRNFEVRYAEYKHYLKTLDEISAAVRIDSEKYFTETVSETFKTIINDPQNSNTALIKLNESLVAMTSNIQKSFARAEGELHGLKLVCSDKLLDMVNDYVGIQREIMTATTRMMETWRNIDINNPSSFMTGDLGAKGEQAKSLYNQILKQMRNELKIN